MIDHRIRPFTYDRDVVSCPRGYYAFGGGGFRTPDRQWLGSQLVQSNGPTISGRSWEFTGFAPAGAGQLEVDVHCARKTGHDFLAVAATETVTTLQHVSAYANCPPGFTEIAELNPQAGCPAPRRPRTPCRQTETAR